MGYKKTPAIQAIFSGSRNKLCSKAIIQFSNHSESQLLTEKNGTISTERKHVVKKC